MNTAVVSPSYDAPEGEIPQPEMRKWGELNLVIEVPKGNFRKVGTDGYEMYMHADYGFVADTVSMEEGDGLDVFINPESPMEPSGKVYTVGMLTSDGVLEEEKVFLNYTSMQSAKDCFIRHYSEGKLGYCYVMSDEDFTKLAQMRQIEAKLKDSNPAVIAAERGEVSGEGNEDYLDLVVDIAERPAVLKGTINTPLYKMAATLSSEQLRKVVETRRRIRNGE